MRLVALKNADKRRPKTFNLAHKFYCSEGQCHCAPYEQRQQVHNPSTGEVGYRDVKRPLCASVTFLAGETKRDLPATALLVPEIASAIGRGELVVI